MSSVFASHYDPAPLREWAKSAPVTTLPALMKKSASDYGQLNFLGWKEGGAYRYRTYQESYDVARQFGAALVALGIEPKDRVALMSTNRPEWALTDIGIMQAAGVNVPIYPTLLAEAAEFILNDSGSRLVVVNDQENAEKLVAAKADALEHIVMIAGTEGHQSDKKLWSWDEFLQFGADKLSEHEAELEKRQEAIDVCDVCSLVYTSGTTGQPKGAMLMHGNFISNAGAVLADIGVESGWVQLSLLPLSHVFERFIFYGMLGAGVTICYAESVNTVKDDILLVEPHIVPAVPRLYEKIHAGVMAKVEAGSALKQKIFHSALDVGRKHFEARCRGSVPKWLKLAYAAAHKLALGKIHQALGGRVHLLVSGGAPLRSDVAEFFLHAGLNLSEGYGLTETSPAICFNPIDRPKIGTVGTAVKHVEVKIADDGEILAKGPNVMLGYFGKVDATAEVIDQEGWFATGDIGQLDDENYLKITDRKKEILVMSNGKNVAPQPIEQAMKSSPYIEQAVLIGDDRKYITALLVPSFASLEAWLKEQGLNGEPDALIKESALVDFLMGECQRTCSNFSAYEQVKKVALLPAELTQEGGELTPKLSVKRRVIKEKYASQIASLYPDQ